MKPEITCVSVLTQEFGATGRRTLGLKDWFARTFVR
jgi:hypothetical protein